MSSLEGLRISVTIPVYNGMPFIKSAVDSVMIQLGGNDELVVIDNASTDGTAQFLQSLSDPRVRLITRDETQDVAANWTQAVLETRGEFVKLMCADDLLLPGALEDQIRLARQWTDCAAVASRRRVIGPNGRTIKSNHGLGPLSGEVKGSDAIKQCAVSGTNLLGEPVCLLFRRDAILSAMPWDADHPYLLDLATYAKAITHANIYCDRRELACFRVSANSWSATIIGDQPTDFRAWREAWVETARVPWSFADSSKANVSLAWRTASRWATFFLVKLVAKRRT